MTGNKNRFVKKKKSLFILDLCSSLVKSETTEKRTLRFTHFSGVMVLYELAFSMGQEFLVTPDNGSDEMINATSD